MDFKKLRIEITTDEGKRNRVYVCTSDANTVGVGHNIDSNGFPKWLLYELSLTPEMLNDPDVLSTIYLDDGQIERLLDHDIMISIDELNSKVRCFREAPEVVQRGLINMHINMGLSRLLSFKKMLKAISDGDFVQAKKESIDSRWFRQVGERGPRVSALIGNQDYTGNYT